MRAALRKRGRQAVPFWGPSKDKLLTRVPFFGPSFFSAPQKCSRPAAAEARSVWQWWNCLEEHVALPRKVLRVNVDETAVRFYMPQRAGLVAKRRRGGPSPTQDASRRQQRACVTHVAAICDDTAVQPLLPQVFIGNEAVLQASAVKLVRPALHKNVILLRRKSGWVNKDFLVSYVKLLAACLEPFALAYQPILLWDALPAHCAPSVLRAAARAGLWVVIVPAKMTWLLQPLDTDVFSRYKHYLRRRYLQLLCDSHDGRVAATSIILAMNDACREVLQGNDWAAAFLRCGFGAAQSRVKRRMAEELELDRVESAGSALPTLMQLSAIFPNRLDAPISELFYPFIPRPPVVPRAPQAADTPAAAADAAPWPARLRPRRSSSELALPSAASSSGPAEPLRLPEVAGLPPEPKAAGPLLAVPQVPRGYRLPAARRLPRPGEATG